MRRIIFLVMSITAVWACSDRPASKVKPENLEKAKQRMAKMDKFPEMQFPYTEVDFGKHKEGEILDTVFVFTNVGEAPLIISKVRTSCGCTASDWPRDPVRPGEKGRIAVRFNTRHKTGKQVKTITIHSNEKQLTRVLKIKAQIEPAEPGKSAPVKGKPQFNLPSKKDLMIPHKK